jgi:acyl-ACP thioesterase
MNSLTKRFEVRSYETDFAKKLKPASFMNYAQYAAEEHAGVLSFGYDDLIAGNNVWVLSRIHVKFLRYPQWNEKVQLTTWHKGTDRLFGIRDFRLVNDSEETMVLATSSWLIIDINTRRVQRVDKILNDESEGLNREDALETPAEKIVIEGEGTILYSRRVMYSDIDVNMHTNNARYVEWATDALWYENENPGEISEMVVNFSSESRAGEHIDILRYVSGNKIIIEGKRADTQIFAVLFTLS